MVQNISFYGSEGAGSVAYRDAYLKETTGSVENGDTAKLETAGSVGVRRNQPRESVDDKGLDRDTVNFRANPYDENSKSSSIVYKIFGIAIGAAAVIAALGAAHKYDLIGKLGDGKFKDFLRKTDAVTKPCHEWCHSTKEFSVKQYNKIVDFIKSKKK